MKKLLTITACVAAIVAMLLPAFAGEKGPQRKTTAVYTNSTSGTVAIPTLGDTSRFTPQWMLIGNIPADCTQAVYYICNTGTSSAVTGTVSAATTASLLSLTNVPTLFTGDVFRVTTQAALGATCLWVTVIGTVYD